MTRTDTFVSKPCSQRSIRLSPTQLCCWSAPERQSEPKKCLQPQELRGLYMSTHMGAPGRRGFARLTHRPHRVAVMEVTACNFQGGAAWLAPMAHPFPKMPRVRTWPSVTTAPLTDREIQNCWVLFSASIWNNLNVMSTAGEDMATPG